MDSKVTKDDWGVWRQNPVTKEYFENLRSRIHDYEASLALGSTLNMDSMDNTFAKTARAVGVISGLREALDVTFGDV